ncbi:MAG: L-histidine N(alpha)-methyltransferase [Dokdonella sp.]
MSSTAEASNLGHSPLQEMRDDVLAGLHAQPKQLPSKYFYDARGSELFEQICAQPEYYLTRAELELMDRHAADIAAELGPHVLLLEYGSGSGAKTRILLEHLDRPAGYVPTEISRAALRESVDALHEALPTLPILPLWADFTQPLDVPQPKRGARRTVVYFPGSTLGNFDTAAATRLLRQMRDEAGDSGGVLVGIDLKKDPVVLEAAYNDAAGVTAEFTLNLLVRLNRELGTDFNLAQFRHRARYNEAAGRIETWLVSQRAQVVHLDGHAIPFDADESMLVEYSCKYSTQEFADLAARAGLRVARIWTDPAQRFSVQYLVAADA